MTTTSQPLTDEEPGPRPTNTNQADNHEEVMLPDEEVTNLYQDKEETRAIKTTTIEMENTATFARSKDTGKRSAGNE